MGRLHSPRTRKRADTGAAHGNHGNDAGPGTGRGNAVEPQGPWRRGFPTGKKWSVMPMGTEARRPKYVVINADEMEPGTFKDRFLLENNPHLTLEGALLAAYALEADVVFFFVRHEYPAASALLTKSIAEARDRGYAGTNILGSGWSVECHVHESAGRYMCGEETALLNALEGRRATPATNLLSSDRGPLWKTHGRQ